MLPDDLLDQLERRWRRRNLVFQDSLRRAENDRRGNRPRRQVWENLEEAELLRAVADQHVLRLLVVIQHHLVGFAANT
jgi:hypothetical protein